MADKNIVIPTPISTTPGITLSFTRIQTGGIRAAVTYDPGAGIPPQVTIYQAAEVDAAPIGIRNAITNLFSAIVPNAATRMGF